MHKNKKFTEEKNQINNKHILINDIQIRTIMRDFFMCVQACVNGES